MAPARLIRWVEDEAGFEALAPEWDRLAAPAGVPFLLHDWVRCWWEAFGGSKTLAVCTVWEGDELTGVFPLCRRGEQLEVMKNVHSPVYRPLARDEDTLRALCAAAVEASGGFLLVAHLPDGDPSIPLLVELASRDGEQTLLERQHVSPIVRLDGFELARKTRKELARLRRRLEEEHEVVFSVLEPPADLEAELREGFAVEASGWKGQRRTAIALAPETDRFYRLVAEAFAARGELRLASVRADGRMVAFDLCLVHAGRLWIPKGGYDEAFRRFAPGLLLTLAEIDRASELGLDAVELLGDDAEWKRKFANDARAHWLVHSYRRRPVPLARYSYRRFVRPRLKGVYRRLAARHA